MPLKKEVVYRKASQNSYQMFNMQVVLKNLGEVPKKIYEVESLCMMTNHQLPSQILCCNSRQEK